MKFHVNFLFICTAYIYKKSYLKELSHLRIPMKKSLTALCIRLLRLIRFMFKFSIINILLVDFYSLNRVTRDSVCCLRVLVGSRARQDLDITRSFLKYYILLPYLLRSLINLNFFRRLCILLKNTT